MIVRFPIELESLRGERHEWVMTVVVTSRTLDGVELLIVHVRRLDTGEEIHMMSREHTGKFRGFLADYSVFGGAGERGDERCAYTRICELAAHYLDTSVN